MSRDAGAAGRQLDVAVAVVCAAAAVVIFVMFHELRHDDDFITFRYGLNLVEGHGLVFNPGQRVLGTSSPLFALISTALYAVVGKSHLPDAAVSVNALALGAQAFLLYLMVRRELPVTAVAVAVLTVAGVGTPFIFLGLETHTYAALLLAAVWSVERDRPLLGGLLTGLAFLARHDAALLVPLLLLRYRRREDTGKGLRLLGAAAAVTLPWLLFATVYYGWPIPRTLQAKQGLSAMSEYLVHATTYSFVVPGFPPSAASHSIAVVLAALGLLIVVRYLRGMLVLVLFAVLLIVVYAWIGPPLSQAWHIFPATLVVRLLIVVGALGSLEARGRRLTAHRRLLRRATVGATAALWLIPLALQAVETRRNMETSMWYGVRHQRYEQVADWLLDHAGPDRSLLAIEVGTLGYLTGYEMVDPFGLVTPTAGDPQDAAHVVELLWTHRPDMVLVHAPWQGRALEGDTPYRTVRVFPWISPWSTLLIRDPSVLGSPRELPRLRRRVARYRAPDGSDLEWPDLEEWTGARNR